MAENNKAQILMYVQQLSHLPFENVEALERRTKTLKHLKKYAMIVHDKDDTEPHVHLVLVFDQRVAVNSVAKQLEDDNERFEIMTKRGNSLERSEQNAFLYLIHRTKNATDKYQYSVENVKANFRYAHYIEKNQEAYQKTLKPKDVITQFAKGLIIRQKAEKLLYEIAPYNIDRNFKKLTDVESAKGHIEYYKWKDEMQSGNRYKRVLWFYGKAGTGKSSAAKHILKQIYGNYFISGGGRDVFENYNNEHGILLDDLRPGFLNYSDILKMLDPHDFNSMVSSRYHNKLIQGETYILTCPLDPYEFYTQTRKKENLSFNDKFDQLERRIDLIIHFDFDDISLEKIQIGFDDSSREIIKDTRMYKKVHNPLGQSHYSMDNLYTKIDKLLKWYYDLPFGLSDITPYETRERIKVGPGKDSKDEDAGEKNEVNSDKDSKDEDANESVNLDLDKYMEDEDGNPLPIYVGPLPCDPNPDDYYLD
ncbi:Rep family protein [Ligilactobacillus sp. 110_WCHN]|uniref:Rep family protein n=1 Tax=Ligilactobacillus sp. 110_WCHN TaxID=3057125 RepID=UPI002671A691|nr:Rep family protein [Ligilactobacillus sp. 110_WCHN]MDO3392804.1 Rep family protein [Ligilactobacillus sp. 110_WCHN]